MLAPATAPGPRLWRPAGADRRPGRAGARRAVARDWPGPAGCGRPPGRREPTAASSGYRRRGATVPARQSPARNASRRWNSTAVSQRRGSVWARSRRLHFEFGLRKPVGRAVPLLRRTSTASSKEGLGHGRRLDVEHAQHARRVAPEAAVASQDVIQRVRRGRVRERGRPGPGLRGSPIRVGSRSPRRAPRRCPARRSTPFPARRMPGAPRGPRAAFARGPDVMRRSPSCAEHYCRRHSQ